MKEILKKIYKFCARIISSVRRKLCLHKDIIGKNNIVSIHKTTDFDNLCIIIRGNCNTIEVGHDCRFMQKTVFYLEGDNNKISIGSNLIAQPNLSLVLAEGTQIIIHDDCLFARDIRMRTSDQHGIYDDSDNRINLPHSIEIGNHVWIGADVVINKGVVIGNDSVVGIKSLVTKQIPNNCVAAGVPARIIKTGTNWSRKIK